MEVELKNLKENFGLAVLRIFGTDFYPGPAYAALRQIFAIRRNLRRRHLSFRWPRLMTGASRLWQGRRWFPVLIDALRHPGVNRQSGPEALGTVILSQPVFYPGHELRKHHGPIPGMVLAGINMGQFMAESGQAASRGIKPDGPAPVVRFRHEDRGAGPENRRRGVVLQEDRRKAQFLANHAAPGLDLPQITGPDQFPAILTTPVAPHPAVKNQVPMVSRVRDWRRI